MSSVQQKTSETAEMIHAISVCNQIQNMMRSHLNNNLPIDEKNINELITNFNVGGLSIAIKHLSEQATNHLEWIESNEGQA